MGLRVRRPRLSFAIMPHLIAQTIRVQSDSTTRGLRPRRSRVPVRMSCTYRPVATFPEPVWEKIVWLSAIMLAATGYVDSCLRHGPWTMAVIVAFTVGAWCTLMWCLWEPAPRRVHDERDA